MASQFNEIAMWKERVETNDKAARKAIDGYKSDHQANIDKVWQLYCKTLNPVLDSLLMFYHCLPMECAYSLDIL